LVSASLTVIAVAGIGDPGFPNATLAQTGITDPGHSNPGTQRGAPIFRRASCEIPL